MAATQTMPVTSFGPKVTTSYPNIARPRAVASGVSDNKVADHFIATAIARSGDICFSGEQIQSFVNDIEKDRTVVPLLALVIRDTVRLYHAQKASGKGVDPDVQAELNTAIIITRTLTENLAFFSGDAQKVIKLYF